MSKYKVTCVTKTDDTNAGITHIGSGTGADEKIWTKAQAISEIEKKTSQFYTEVGGVTANVVVAGVAPNKYLTTHPDDTKKNNLLSLPSC